MNLSDIFRPGKPNIRQADTARSSGSIFSGDRSYRGQSEIRNLVPGQTIRGEVVGKDGNTVQIALDRDTILNARLERDLNIALGQNMSFEVKSNGGSLLSLIPLYANMANEATIMKALSAAGLEATADNIQMVGDMMQEGMPIDKDTIGYVARQLMDFPDANPSSVIQMLRLGIPLSLENIEQFEMYQNYEHQMVESAGQIMEELPLVYESLIAEGRDAEAAAFYDQILQALLGSGTAETEGELLSDVQADQENGADSGIIRGEVIAETGDGRVVASADNAEELAAEIKQAADLKSILSGETETAGEIETAGGAETAGETVTAGDRSDSGPLSRQLWNELGERLEQLGTDPKVALQIKNGMLSPKDVLEQVSRLLSERGLSERREVSDGLKDLLGSKGFKELLKEEMTNQWLIDPKEVADKEKVEQLYARIREQTAKMSEAFEMVGKGETTAAKSVQNLQNNIDFMNQINHLFTYIQLPLKMAGNQAHGDLYVYTNKKSLAKRDGNVTALLHLDMEHLGPVDVFVSMQQTKVTTNFTLRDDAALDLIAEHIHILDKRLEERGYSMKANFHLKDEEVPEETNIMQEILAQSKNISVLSRTSFDMRA